MEIWKKIQINPNYEISSLGNVRSITHKTLCKDGRTRTYVGKNLVPKIDRHGYKRVALGRQNDNIAIHRLVAQTFIDNPNNYPCINHIDGNKLNNSIENLEWCTYSENLIHAYKTKLNPRPKRVKQMTMDGVLIKEWESATQCSKETGISRSKIGECCLGKRKAHRGYRWVFC